MIDQKVLKQVVGIDMGMESFFACYQVKDQQEHVVIKGTKSFKNNSVGMKEFLFWCKKREKATAPQTIYVMEATGVYYENLAYFLYENDQKVKIGRASCRERV